MGKSKTYGIAKTKGFKRYSEITIWSSSCTTCTQMYLNNIVIRHFLERKIESLPFKS